MNNEKKTICLLSFQSAPEGWRIVFYMAAGLSLFGAISFQLFGSGLEQDWAKYNSGTQFDKLDDETCQKIDLKTNGNEKCDHFTDTDV